MADLYDFHRHVVIRPRTRCWIWTGCDVRGYGHITFKKKIYQAHRLSYLQHNGPIADGAVVMHSCDNPRCVNPEHLEAGTQRKNILDCHRRGRAAFNLPKRQSGEENPASKLTDQQVREIRASTDRQVDVAKRYGVSQTLISKIKRREAWLHLSA
jgi:hypothetical protein